MIVILLHIFCKVSFGQNRIDIQNIRTATLRSDVILLSPNFSMTNKFVNDYTIEQFYTINKIDTIVKNKTRFKPDDKIKILQYAEDYSAYWGEDMIHLSSDDYAAVEFGARYSNIFFVKADGILESQLTSSCSDDYEKYKIMRYFIKKIEHEQKSEK